MTKYAWYGIATVGFSVNSALCVWIGSSATTDLGWALVGGLVFMGSLFAFRNAILAD